MSAWMIARSKADEAALPEGAAAGAREFALEDADEKFVPGDPVFISNPDGSSAEYLGPVTASDALGFSTAFGVRVAKPAGALLWKPAARLAFDAESGAGAEMVREPGFVLLQTLGGGNVSVQTRAPRERSELALKGLTPAACDALEAWLRDEADGGRLPFTLISASRDVTAAQWNGERAIRKDQGGGRIALRLPLALIGRGLYA